ncbi:MAG: BREX system ATP-binding protein BrxD [Candidatus Eremiobacterota bacterium]
MSATLIVNALRAGTVPPEGLHHFAVGLDPLAEALREQRDYVAGGHSAYKFLRGPYGSGKTFLASLAAAQALEEQFVVTRVVVSPADTPLYRLNQIYRRLCQGLSTSSRRGGGALQAVVDRWLYQVEQTVIEVDCVAEASSAFSEAVARKVQQQLVGVGEQAGRLAACLSAYQKAQLEQDFDTARGLLDWISGEPKVSAAVKRVAGVTGQLDNTDVLAFLRGLLVLLRACGYRGLVVILDEVETTLRMQRPERLKSLEVLRQLVDALDHQDFPGLQLLVTGTPDFFQSQFGVPSLEPLHDRIRVDFREDQPDNLRQPQLRLKPFDRPRLLEVARKVRALYPARHRERLDRRADDGFLDLLIQRVAAGFGGRISVMPRLFLRELVHQLDLVDQHPDYDPAAYAFRAPGELVLTPDEEVLLGDSARSIEL